MPVHVSLRLRLVAFAAIDQVEHVEVIVELPPDTFTLEATFASRASVPRP